jgi:hypothetical protein
MRVLILAIVVAATSCLGQHDIMDDAPGSGIAESPNHDWKVRFRQAAPDDEWKNCGEVTVYHHGRKVLRHCIPRLVSRAAWSPDSKYCVFTTINVHGHQAWSYAGVVFSTADHSFRWLDDAVGSINAPDFHFEPPDTLVVRVLSKNGDVTNGVDSRASLQKIFAKLRHDNET